MNLTMHTKMWANILPPDIHKHTKIQKVRVPFLFRVTRRKQKILTSYITHR